MNVKLIGKFSVLLLGGVAFGYFIKPVNADILHNTKDGQLLLDKMKEQDAADQKLGQYAINAMYLAGAKDKLSDARKQILARATVRVSNDIFEKEEERRSFISIIAIESGFQRFVQSPTGPKGLSQVAKSSFHEAM